MNKREMIIVGFVSDLKAKTRIEEAVQRAGFRIEWVKSPEPEAGLMEKLTQWQPALFLFDLGSQGIPWRTWLPWIKTSPATRRIPAICFGAHQDVEAIKAAQQRGADAVLRRSSFFAGLPGLIQQYARLPDYAALQETCQQPLSELALEGLCLFNQGEYFEAHEALETAWNAEPGPGRELYRAILQVGVAYLQIERGNYDGAVKMFQRLRQWIDPLPDKCRGVDIAGLRRDAEAVYAHLVSLGPERLEEFDRDLFKAVIY
jgi:predicted metal-dependent hydrolase/CheY-like chemotaxis protein